MNNHSSDDQFYSWPLRVKKTTGSLSITPQSYETIYKNHIMSLDIIPDISGNGNCILSSFESIGLNGNKIKMLDIQENGLGAHQKSTPKHTLDSLLESLPLVYNPSTKQLQVVKLRSKSNNTTNGNVVCKNKIHLTCKCSEEECCELIPKSKSQIEDFNRFATSDLEHCSIPGSDISSCGPFVPVSHSRCLSITNKTCDKSVIPPTYLRDTSCTASFESITSASLSCSTPETSLSPPSLSPRLKLDDTCNRETAKKKKGITEFLTRNLFPWRSKNCGKVSLNQPECDAISVSSDASAHDDTSGNWKIFSKSDDISHSTEIITHEMPAGTAGLIMEERPGNLPAKTLLEQERHVQEYRNIVSAARKKEMREAKDRRKAQAVQLKLEKHLSDSVHTWNSVIIPKWSTMRCQKKCQELWWAGLPSCVRGNVWKLAIGNELNITPEQYADLVQRSLEKLSKLDINKSFESDCNEASDESRNQESTLKLIQLDVSRTFPHLCIFQDGGPFHDPLHNILGAYVCYRPDVGYVQGMSFLAATFLLNMEESDAFIYFANLINRPPHMAFYTVDQRVMHAYFATFEEVLHENLPDLANHLKNLKVLPNMYFLDWVLTIFARSFPLDVAARIWDVYLRDGEEFFFRAAIGILKHFEKELLVEDCTAHAAQFLTRLPEELNCDAFFKDVASVPIVTSRKVSFREVLSENLKNL